MLFFLLILFVMILISIMKLRKLLICHGIFFPKYADTNLYKFKAIKYNKILINKIIQLFEWQEEILILRI